MNLYGYPTVVLKDKETGRVKREISCKNIQTIPARMMLSNVGYFEYAAYNEAVFGIGTRSGSNDNSSDVYTLPFRMPKTPFYYQNKPLLARHIILNSPMDKNIRLRQRLTALKGFH